MDERQDKPLEAKSRGKVARGRTELLRHYNGKRITQRQAILAKCYDCMGYYRDGKVSCEIPTCPLFPLMPYRAVSQEGKDASKNRF